MCLYRVAATFVPVCHIFPYHRVSLYRRFKMEAWEDIARRFAMHVKEGDRVQVSH